MKWAYGPRRQTRPRVSAFTEFSAFDRELTAIGYSPYCFHFSPEYLERKGESAIFSSLRILSTSESWLHGSIFDDVDSLPVRMSGWRGSGRLKQTNAKKMVSLNLFFPWWGSISKWAVATTWFWTNVKSRDNSHFDIKDEPPLNNHLKSSPHYLCDPNVFICISCKISLI